MRIILALVIGSVPLLPRGAFAQESRAWVDGRILWNSDQSWSNRVPASAGGGFSIGLELTHRIGVEISGDWPMPATSSSTTSFLDPNFGPERVTERETFATPTGTGAVRVSLSSSPRVRVTVLGGLAFVSHTSTLHSTIERGTGTLELSRADTFGWGGPLVGVETSIRVADHLALVPQVRVIWFPLSDSGTTIVRPAFGVRVMF